jgi:hypothetical protein
VSSSLKRRLTASRVPPIWWTCEARIVGPSARGSADSSAAAQPSPKIADPTVLLGVGVQRLRGEPHQRHAARAADAGDVVLVGRGIHAEVVHETVRQRGAAERVEARGEHRADLRRVDRERIDGMDRIAHQVVLDPRAASLQRELQELVAQFEVPVPDAAAGEDPLGELVAGEPQPIEHLSLGEHVVGVRHGERRDPRTRTPRGTACGEDRTGERGWAAGGVGPASHGRGSLIDGGRGGYVQLGFRRYALTTPRPDARQPFLRSSSAPIRPI